MSSSHEVSDKVSKKRLIKYISIALLLLILGSATAFKIYTLNYYKEDTATISEIESNGNAKVIEYDDNTLLFIPQNKDLEKAGIVFYPGGKVEYTSYSGLMYELAERGFVCILTRMPENLAFLDLGAASGYEDVISQVSTWYMAGHSLGGAAAGIYISDQVHNNKDMPYEGIILLASYVTKDLSDTDLRLLSIYGSNDSVLNMENYEDGKTNWPSDASEYVIDGGIHSYFGCYGIQSGDGTPSVTNIEQIRQTADIIEKWVIMP